MNLDFAFRRTKKPLGRVPYPVFIVLLSILSSCAHKLDYLDSEAIEKRLSYKSWFQSCYNKDGAVLISSQNPPVPSLTMDWIIDTSRGLRTEVSDPIGQTALELQLNSDGLSSRGTLAKKLETISVGRNGWLFYEDNKTPVKWYEISCFLNLKVPNSWKNKVVNLKSKGLKSKNQHLIVRDDERDIQLTLSSSHLCAEFVFPVFWNILYDSFEMCFDQQKRKGKIKYEDFRMKWKVLDD